jgi:CRP-like cAMP-binding protein
MEENLLKSPLFSGITADELSAVLDEFSPVVRTFSENDFVMLQGDSYTSLLLIINGKLQAQMVDSSGKLIVIEEFTSGQVLAPAFLYAEQNKLPVSLFVLEKTEILSLKKSVFTAMMQKHQVILTNFLQLLSNRTAFLTKKLQFHAFKNIKSKIAYFLLNIYREEKNAKFKLPQTQQNIADLLGVTRPSLARSFAEMEKEGLLVLSGKNVELLDINRLQQLAE